MKVFTGKVISKKMQKTATVAVQRTIKHPVYKKRFTRIKKYHVHDELGVAVGEEVRFVASRPYSKMVKWNIIDRDMTRSEAKKPKKPDARSNIKKKRKEKNK